MNEIHDLCRSAIREGVDVDTLRRELRVAWEMELQDKSNSDSKLWKIEQK